MKFAYRNLPEALRKLFPLEADSAEEMLFAHNNSSIRVSTSMRSGTLHRLHISEFGKICAKYPDKAAEVMTGSIPAVPLGGILVIESTAEGQEGDFFIICDKAGKQADAGAKLTKRDYRMHFFPWHEQPDYRMDPAGVVITKEDREYFEEVEAQIGKTLDAEQRAWYVATREADFYSKPERMWQEYPSTRKEAFQNSSEGCYFVNQMMLARKQGRICRVPVVDGVPVNTFWDIGLNDEMVIWFHQFYNNQHRFINYYENSGESFGHYVRHMQSLGYVWGRHYLPHDGDTQRLGTDTNLTPLQMLEDLGLRNIEIVERTPSIIAGIQVTRDKFSQTWIDEVNCAQGIAHLDNYKKQWDARRGAWKDEPLHNKASNGADAFRQWAQGYGITSTKRPKKSAKDNWRTA